MAITISIFNFLDGARPDAERELCALGERSSYRYAGERDNLNSLCRISIAT
jgi:hypothetical protein